MTKDNKLVEPVLSFYWRVYRLVFVVFALYFTGIMLHSWDGLKYYGTFSDFLPGISLVLVLWSILAVIVAISICCSFKVVEWGCFRIGWKISIEHMLIFLVFMFLLGFPWNSEFLIWKLGKSSERIQLIILAALPFLALFLVTLFRNRAIAWISIIQERIKPLVWIFGALALFSSALVVYNIVTSEVWGEKNKEMSLETNRPSSVTNNRPNIVLITFDALTSRNMSMYGYHKETTPFIADWAKNASIFTMTEAESNYTAPTTASIMTGKRVWNHRLYNAHGYNVENADKENLAFLLKNNGYYNIALIQNSLASVSALGISKSFDIVPSVEEFMEPASVLGVTAKTLYKLFGSKYHRYNWMVQTAFLGQIFYRKIPIEVRLTEYPPEKIFDKFLEVMENGPPEPFFAWLHIFPPHDPYLPPEPFLGMFDSSHKLRTESSQWLSNDFDTARARYDEFIMYCDMAFGNFIKELMKHDKKIVIVLSADHGHSFEHNYRGHGGPHLYEQMTNIPLVIKEPGQTKGRIVNDVTEQIDIAPTILELAGLPAPSWIEGRSLVPLMQGNKLQSKPAISMQLQSTPNGHKIVDGTFAIWEGDYKLIHYLKENKSLLFNLKRDPGELNNLADQETEIAQRLLGYIMTNLMKVNEELGKEQ